MKTKIERAGELHRTMTPHQMALRIVELQDAPELAEEAVRAKQQAMTASERIALIKRQVQHMREIQPYITSEARNWVEQERTRELEAQLKGLENGETAE